MIIVTIIKMKQEYCSVCITKKGKCILSSM